MKVLLAGPIFTDDLRSATGFRMPGAPGGTAQTPIVPLAVQLMEMGNDVSIVTLDPGISHTESYSEGALNVTYCPLRAPPRYKTRVRSFDFFEREIRLITAAMRLHQPDIVHAHWTYEFAEAAVRSRLPHLVTMHDLGWDCFWRIPDPYRLVRLLMKYRTLHRVKALSVVSPMMLERAWHYGYLGKPTLIPNGVEVASASHPTTDRLKSPILVTVGDRGPLKNVEASVQAMTRIRRTIPDASLHLFGPGLESTPTLREKGIFGHGYVAHAELMAFLAEKAALLIHPSRFESFGVVLAEAKMRGIPVIAGKRSGGVPFTMGACNERQLVDIDDPAAIASAAVWLLQNPSIYDDVSQWSADDARGRFSIRAVADQYVELYNRIVEPAQAA